MFSAVVVSSPSVDPPATNPDVVLRRRVIVSLGPHTISEYYADAELAARYTAAMSRRFPGLQVTDQPLLTRQPAVPDLPADHLLWPLTAL